MHFLQNKGEKFIGISVLLFAIALFVRIFGETKPTQLAVISIAALMILGGLCLIKGLRILGKTDASKKASVEKVVRLLLWAVYLVMFAYTAYAIYLLGKLWIIGWL